MRLLIITQKADRLDPVLGFFHRWVQEFAKRCDSVIVLAQQEGEHKLPANVRVLSLGKEHGVPTSAQVKKAWKLLWTFRRDYDVVLVHMTPVWNVLTAPLLILLRKPRYLWYEVRRGGWILKLALLTVKKVFCATPAGLPFSSKKAVMLGHGIDTDEFSAGTEPRDPHLIAAAGRITPIKHYDALLSALSVLPASMHLEIAGGTVTPGDLDEEVRLSALTQELGLSARVSFRPRTHTEVRDLFRRALLSLHASDGGLDKALLEAISCGCLVVSSSEAAQHILPVQCMATKETLGQKAKELLALSAADREGLTMRLRHAVMEGHSLPTLIVRMTEEMKG